MTTWSVNVYPLNSGTASATGVPVRGHSFNYVLNAPGSFDADLPLRDTAVTQAIFSPGAKEIRVYRDAVLVWGGYLQGVRVQARDSVTIRAEGYLSRLRRRYVMSDLLYTDTAQETICWDLIDHTQTQSGGDCGITQGTHTGSSITRDADYCALNHPNVADEIASFTEYFDGLDFDITPTNTTSTNKVFRTYEPKKGSDLSGTVIFTDSNVATMTYEWSGDNLISRLVTTGNGDCNPPEDDRTDSTALSTYGLLQEFVSVDTEKLSEVRAFGQHTVANYSVPQLLMQVEYAEGAGILGWGQYEVGDIVHVATSFGPTGGFADLDLDMRVLTLEVNNQPPNITFYRATLDSVTS